MEGIALKRNLKSVMSLAVASAALVGSLGLASIASAASDFSGFPTLRQGDSGDTLEHCKQIYGRMDNRES